MLVDFSQANKVVIHRLLNRRNRIFPDVDTQDAASASERGGAAQMLQHFIGPMVIKTHAVDHAFSWNHSEKSWFGIARLRLRRNGADFNVTETQAAECTHTFAVFIHPRSQPDDIWESQSHHFNRIFNRISANEFSQSEINGPVQIRHDYRMSRFRIHGK